MQLRLGFGHHQDHAFELLFDPLFKDERRFVEADLFSGVGQDRRPTRRFCADAG